MKYTVKIKEQELKHYLSWNSEYALIIYKSVWKALKFYQPFVTELYIYLCDIGTLVHKQDWFTEDKELSHPLHHWLAASEVKNYSDVLPSDLTMKCSQPCYWKSSMTLPEQAGEKDDRISAAVANRVSSGDQIHFWTMKHLNILKLQCVK